MSAPLLLPKGNDRTWTRSFYKAINKVFRRIWWEQGGDQMVTQAIADCMVKGVGYYRVRPLSNNHTDVQRAVTAED